MLTNTSDGFANMYEYLQAPESFVILNRGEANVAFGGNRIKVDLKGVFAGDTMLLSFKWFPNWKGFYEGGTLDISCEEEINMIEVTIPQSGDYPIELEFI